MWIHTIKTMQKIGTILYILLNRILIVKEHIQYIEKRITLTDVWTELTVRGSASEVFMGVMVTQSVL